MSPAPNQQQNLAALNAQARMLIKARGIKRTNQIQSLSVVPSNNPQVTINPQNVGLGLGFWVQVIMTVNNGSGVDLNLTDFGPANALSQIQFNDLQNNTRIQVPGWFLHMVNSLKAKRPYGTAFVRTTGIDTPINWGSNMSGQISAPAQILAGDSGTVIMWYYVPLAYSDQDWRGAVYLNVINATAQIILSFPGNGGLTQNGVTVAVAAGADSTLAMFQGAAAGSVAAVTITNATVNVSQVYMDQLPTGPQGIILPPLDVSTIYELKQTTLTAVVPNQDFPYQYPNYRDILSTVVIFNNAVGGNTGAVGARGEGEDINYWELLSANFTAIWKKTPSLVALENRNIIGADPPPGVYYFSYRDKPISTNQYGNMQLVLNALTAGAGAYLMVGIEDLALMQTLTAAGSLAAS
jgi:P3 major capsid protein